MCAAARYSRTEVYFISKHSNFGMRHDLPDPDPILPKADVARGDPELKSRDAITNTLKFPQIPASFV